MDRRVVCHWKYVLTTIVKQSGGSDCGVYAIAALAFGMDSLDSSLINILCGFISSNV